LTEASHDNAFERDAAVNLSLDEVTQIVDGSENPFLVLIVIFVSVVGV
jgi:hypothetical protein